METVIAWFQDWLDACRYANECAPDMSFLHRLEPWSAFVAIALACAAVWLWNEKRLSPILKKELAAAPPQTRGNLAPVLDQLKAASPATAHQRAA